MSDEYFKKYCRELYKQEYIFIAKVIIPLVLILLTVSFFNAPE
jgi:hypothetical protein